MPFTLDQLDFLGVHLGIAIPPAIIENKRRAEEFKARREKTTGEAGGKPADWWLKAQFEDALSRASEAADKKQFDAAFKLLDEADQLLVQPEASKAPPEGGPAAEISIFKLSKARVEWEGVRSHATTEFKRLKNILQAEYAGDAVEQAAVAAALKRLDTMITSINEELGDRLDKVLNADPAERPKLTTGAKTVLERFVSFATSDMIMSVIDGNEYAPDMQVAAPLRAKLQEITAALG